MSECVRWKQINSRNTFYSRSRGNTKTFIINTLKRQNKNDKTVVASGIFLFSNLILLSSHHQHHSANRGIWWKIICVLEKHCWNKKRERTYICNLVALLGIKNLLCKTKRVCNFLLYSVKLIMCSVYYYIDKGSACEKCLLSPSTCPTYYSQELNV